MIFPFSRRRGGRRATISFLSDGFFGSGCRFDSQVHPIALGRGQLAALDAPRDGPMDPQEHVNRYYPGVAHIPYNNRNSSFLKEMMVREDVAHEAWKAGGTYLNPRRPTIDVGLYGQPTANLLRDDAPIVMQKQSADKAKPEVQLLKDYEKQLRASIEAERAAREDIKRQRDAMKGKSGAASARSRGSSRAGSVAKSGTGDERAPSNA